MPVITTNTSANSALRYLNINSDEQTNALNKVASGSRITRASDDAAGLAVATKLQSDVAVLGQASTNASHASSILETADGGLSSISDVLERMKVLCAESMSGAVSDTERTYINSEFSALMDEIDSIVSTTTFNGTALLSGTYSADFLVGTAAGDTITADLATNAAFGNIADLATAYADLATGVGSAANAATALTAVNSAIGDVAAARAEVGAQESRFDYHAAQINSSEENLDAAQSAIMDADVAEAQSEFSSAQVKTNAAIAALASANSMPQQLLSLLQ
ncbi:Flagellin-like protein [uncultured Alphaproteobacteria bacterium]|uniref:Flagellin n=1 Tax=uncultured Alphaproteobacteria bacterium TaxID=91750 RepID=A0A212JVT3_9PROT|nr:Flagellin-like protein [uncultured Alphaproteobacteria bacterium]